MNVVIPFSKTARDKQKLLRETLQQLNSDLDSRPTSCTLFSVGKLTKLFEALDMPIPEILKEESDCVVIGLSKSRAESLRNRAEQKLLLIA
ncbi:MAG: hypothetical protein R3D88_04410 [Alphaproteobacteria bacterium]|nr:hypothetical protein [Alphaproteobacteria bacterium]